MTDPEMTEIEITPEDLAVYEAQRLFTERAAQHWFSAPSCNRFEFRFLDNGMAVLTFGSIGIVEVDGELISIATPVATIQADPSLLRNLADLIDANLPKQAEASGGD